MTAIKVLKGRYYCPKRPFLPALEGVSLCTVLHFSTYMPAYQAVTVARKILQYFHPRARIFFADGILNVNAFYRM